MSDSDDYSPCLDWPEAQAHRGVENDSGSRDQWAAAHEKAKWSRESIGRWLESQRKKHESRVARPVAYKSDGPADFWNPVEFPERSLQAAVVELEVYRALREALDDDPDPDFVLDRVWPTSEEAADRPGWGVRMFIDGRGLEDLVRWFDFDALLSEELSSMERHDTGEPEGTVPEIDTLKRLASRIRQTADRLDEWLGRAQTTDGKDGE